MNITFSVSSALWLAAIVVAAYIGYRKEKKESQGEN